MERTPWFSMKTLPIREGEYEVKLRGEHEVMRLSWCADGWFYEDCCGKMFLADTMPGDRWRGLTRPADDGGGR